MTQDKDFKKLVRQHAQKTGKSYSAARKDYEARVASAASEPATDAFVTDAQDPVPALLSQLRAAPFAVLVGRLPAIGLSSDYATAAAHARDLAENPKYSAESGSVTMLVTYDQLEALTKAGAARNEDVQMVRTFRNEHGTTFSKRCRHCRRWIWCGDVEREGECACGQKYRVVFDLAAAHRWSERIGRLCMDCGDKFGLTEAKHRRNPWTTVNEWQIRCQACDRKHAEKVEVAASLQRQSVIMAEATITMARRFHRGRDEALVEQAASSLDDLKAHHERVLREFASGRTDEDEQLEEAALKLQHTLEVLRAAVPPT